MNWWAVTVISIWLSAAVGSWGTKDEIPFVCALFGTTILGIGYLILNC
jgi:hypothetical protein